MSGDRTVHARCDVMEVVRYDRSGKWYLEPVDGSQRQHVRIGDAVKYALWAWGQPGGAVFPRLHGGGRFDALLIRHRALPVSAGVGSKEQK